MIKGGHDVATDGNEYRLSHTRHLTGEDNKSTGGLADGVRSRVGVIAWVILIPILLAALGAWQFQRATETLKSTYQSRIELEAMRAEVQKIMAENPQALLTLGREDGTTQTVTALVATSRVDKALSQVSEEIEISQVRYPLSFGTIGGAALAFVSGAGGLMLSSVAARCARKSQQQLITSFRRQRLVLPFVIAAVVVGFGIASMSALLFEAASMGFWADFTAGSAKLFGLAIVLAAFAAYGVFLALRGLKDVFALYTPDVIEVFGRVVDEAAAPGLWRLVRLIADKQQSLLPDTIIIGLTQGFFVTESQVRLSPGDVLVKGRSLYLPAPYLDLLDAPEIATIIGHELAHFSGEDTRYSQEFAPIYAAFVRALGALEIGDRRHFVLYPAIRLGLHMMRHFDEAVAHWSRLRELDADRLGSAVSTRKAAASALIRVGIIEPATSHVLERAFLAAHEREPGARTDLVAQVTESGRVEGWTDPLPQLEDRQSHPTDSHPPTFQRIAALGIPIDDELLQRATRQPEPDATSLAARLFSDWAGLCASLSEDFLENAGEARARYRQDLEHAAAGATGEIVVYDNVGPMIWTMGIVAVILGGFGILIFFFSERFGFTFDETARQVVGAVTAAAVVACAAYSVFLYRSARRPLMVLTPDGLVSSVLDKPIAWIEVSGYMVYASSRFALRLWLHEGSALPGKSWQALYTQVDRKKRIVTLGAMGIRGMKAVEFSELVGRYQEAAYARQELKSGFEKA